jgi:hypothetical protein
LSDDKVKTHTTITVRVHPFFVVTMLSTAFPAVMLPKESEFLPMCAGILGMNTLVVVAWNLLDQLEAAMIRRLAAKEPGE